MKTQIIVKLQIEGIHNWLNCPLEDVHFLRFDHRHIFHIKAIKTVSHDDRDVEIILLKRSIQEWIKGLFSFCLPSGSTVCNFGQMSCEMIARQVLLAFDLDECEVLEDDENGARVVK